MSSEQNIQPTPQPPSVSALAREAALREIIDAASIDDHDHTTCNAVLASLQRAIGEATAEQDATIAAKDREIAELRNFVGDPHLLHGHCVRTLTDGQVAHLFGERMTAIANERDQLRADVERMRNAWGDSERQISRLKEDSIAQDMDRASLRTQLTAAESSLRTSEELCDRLAEALQFADKELTRLFIAVPLAGPLPSGTVMQHVSAALAEYDSKKGART